MSLSSFNCEEEENEKQKHEETNIHSFKPPGQSENVLKGVELAVINEREEEEKGCEGLFYSGSGLELCGASTKPEIRGYESSNKSLSKQTTTVDAVVKKDRAKKGKRKFIAGCAFSGFKACCKPNKPLKNDNNICSNNRKKGVIVVKREKNTAEALSETGQTMSAAGGTIGQRNNHAVELKEKTFKKEEDDKVDLKGSNIWPKKRPLSSKCRIF
jgi:hypothetical protein